MSKSLKRIPEQDTLDFGKAVTIVLSGVKELSKTHNDLVDGVDYLEARKKQETESLERILAEKTDVLKVKADVTAKIIAQKSEFSNFIASKHQELATIEANLKATEANLTDKAQKEQQTFDERQNELELRSNDFKKEMQASMEALNQRESSLIAREEVVTAVTNQNTEEKLELDALRSQLEAQRVALGETDAARASKKLELDNREANLADKEAQLETQRRNLANLAADLENQASLIEREKSKNKSDLESIRSMQKKLYDKQAELDNRELHLKDRESTILTH